MNNSDTNTNKNVSRRMVRPREGRVLGGVATSLASHTGGSVALIRIGFVIAALIGGLGVILYAAAWALLPSAGEEETPAERWLANLTTPGKRLGALLIGIAGLFLLAGAHGAALVAAVVVLSAAALLAGDSPQNTQSTPAGHSGIETE